MIVCFFCMFICMFLVHVLFQNFQKHKKIYKTQIPKNRRKTNRRDYLCSNTSIWIPVVSTPWSFASDQVPNSGGAVCFKISFTSTNFYLLATKRHVKNPKASASISMSGELNSNNSIPPLLPTIMNKTYYLSVAIWPITSAGMRRKTPSGHE